MKLYSITYEDSDAVEHHISFAPTRREARAMTRRLFAEGLVPRHVTLDIVEHHMPATPQGVAKFLNKWVHQTDEPSYIEAMGADDTELDEIDIEIRTED